MTALRIKDVCARLSVGRRTVDALISSGVLRAFQIGKRWRVTEAELDAFIVRQRRRQDAGAVVTVKMYDADRQFADVEQVF